MIALNDIDVYLSEHGNFCLLDWLIQKNIVSYSSYESWRLGSVAHLEGMIQLDAKKLKNILVMTEQYCLELGLRREEKFYYQWDVQQQILLAASKDKNNHQQISQHWVRSQDKPQLDLFMDNAAVVAENMVQDALATRQFERAQKKLKKLIDLNENNSKLGAYQDLINYGQHATDNGQIEFDEIEQEMLALQNEVLPLADETLGVIARDYLTFGWRRLAENLQGVGFNAEKPQLHRSFALSRIPDWRAVTECLLQQADLYTQAILLDRLSQSFEMQHDIEKSLIVWCLLVELDADYAQKAIENKNSQIYYNLWEDFWELNDSGPKSFFSAYILAVRPGLIHLLDEFEPLCQPANVAMIEVLRMRIAGHGELPGREKLQHISPALLRLYMDVISKKSPTRK